MKTRRLLITLILAALILSSCSLAPKETNDSVSNSGTDTPKTSESDTNADDNDTQTSKELITLTAVANIDNQTQDRIVNAVGETPENNRWNDLIAEELGYKIEYLWVTNDQEQYNQKFNTSIAAGDIPDIVRLNKVQFGQAVEGGLLADIGTLFDEHASPLLKKIMDDAGPLPVEAATHDGVQYALPKVDADIERGALLWIRHDWLEQANLEVPTTIDEMIEVMKAFNEIAGEGAVGLPIQKEIFLMNNAFRINGFSYGYNAYPRMWIEKDDELVFGSIQPEMKEALAKLNEIYNMGLIDPEFIVKDEVKVNEAIVSGKSGLFYGAHWSSLAAIHDSVMQDENAVWKPHHIPYKDSSGAAKVGIEMATDEWFASSVGSPAPEAVIQLANLYCDKTFDPEKQEYEKYSNPGGQAEGLWKYSPVYMMTPLKNIDTTIAIRPYLDANDNSDTGDLFGEQLTMLDYALAGQNGDRELMGWNSVFGIDGSCQVQYEQQIKPGNTMMNMFYGAPTPTMVTNEKILEAAFDAEIVKIINGQSPLDAFDAAVQAWLDGGGQKITDEVNSWYKNK